MFARRPAAPARGARAHQQLPQQPLQPRVLHLFLAHNRAAGQHTLRANCLPQLPTSGSRVNVHSKCLGYLRPGQRGLVAVQASKQPFGGDDEDVDDLELGLEDGLDGTEVLDDFVHGVGLDEDEEYGEFEDDEELPAWIETDDAGAEDWVTEERDGAPADSGEPSTSDAAAPGSQYPARPERSKPLFDLLLQAGFFSIATDLAPEHAEMQVSGIHSNPLAVNPGSAFVLHDWMFPDEAEDLLEAALSNGASVIVMPESLELPSALSLPRGTVAVSVDDSDDAGQRLAAAFYDDPTKDMVVVGITGSYGKTTTAWLVRGILEELGLLTGMVDSIEYAVGEDRLDPDGDIWVPDQPDPSAERECSSPFKIAPYAGKYATLGARCPGLNVQKMLAGMGERGAKCAVVECHPMSLDQGFFDSMHVNVAVLTNLSGLDSSYFDSAEEQAEAAMRLFTKMADSGKQAAVVNLDDPLADLFCTCNEVVPLTTYSTSRSRGADVYPESVVYSIWETEMIVVTPKGKLQIITNFLGVHNVSNILAAVATGIALQAPVKSIVAGIEAVEAIPGRSEVIDEGQPFSVVVDAAQTPEQLSALLTALQQGGAERIFTVLGCGGDEQPEKRPQMGRVAHELSQYVILTNENPRTEDPAKIIQDIVAGFPDDLINKYSNYVYFPFQDQGRVPLWFEPHLQKTQRDTLRYVMEDRYSAIRCAIGTAAKGDVVVLAGKGCEDFIEYGDGEGGIIRGWFDDRVEARSALSKLRYLDSIRLKRDTLPWGTKIEELMDTIVHIPPDADVMGAAAGSAR